jgi:uncharacterized protein
MMKLTGTRRLLRGLIIVIFLNVIAAQAGYAGDKVFMWKVESRQAVAYILGTVHMMKKEMYPLDARIEEAFRKSGFYALEFNIDEAGLLQKDLMTDIIYSGDDNIRNHISRETIYLAAKKLEEAGMPFDLMTKFKPWFLAVSIELFEYQKLGFDPQYGLDKYFLQKAEGTKEIIELESFELQMELFRSMSDRDQELFLGYSIKEIDDSEKNMDSLLSAWSKGDAGAMENLMFDHSRDDPRLSRLYDRLFYERNRNMADKITKLLAARGTYFIAVGAGHLVGKQGIIEILARKGFSVLQQ